MKNLNELHYFEVPTVMKHALGAVNHLPGELAILGVKKPLLVTDQGVVKAGLLDQVLKPLKDASVSYVLYDQVVFNPPLATVAAGTEMYKKNGCDGIIALAAAVLWTAPRPLVLKLPTTNPFSNTNAPTAKKS
jgi:choline dehydrogenase